VAGAGKTGDTVDLSYLFDGSVENPNRTLVQFTTNFDIDTQKPGLQPGIIRLELFDDQAPLTVQNFLTYVNNQNARGDYDGTFLPPGNLRICAAGWRVRNSRCAGSHPHRSGGSQRV
jgi:hypothetical protein